MPPKKKKKVVAAAQKPKIQKKMTPSEPTDLEYQTLFDTCVITKEKLAEVDKLIEEKVIANRKRYEDISGLVSGRTTNLNEGITANGFKSGGLFREMAEPVADLAGSMADSAAGAANKPFGFKTATNLLNGGLDWLNPFASQPEQQFPMFGFFAGSKIPWYFIACIHHLESSFNFNGHLHNGDPLTGYTVQEPRGYPKKLQHGPPFTFEESAVDALRLKKFDKITSWKLPVILRNLEKYNGFGYFRYRNINTPYLWSYSNHYTKGKYTSDKKYDVNAVSKQLGAAVILKRMEEKGTIYIPRF